MKGEVVVNIKTRRFGESKHIRKNLLCIRRKQLQSEEADRYGSDTEKSELQREGENLPGRPH